MTNKALAYAMFAEQKAQEISTSHRNWTSYLKTASRMYKYSYYDQLLIHAQRPDATACASYELWNKRMQRYIKRGSTGIGLLDIDQEHTRLHYVFDVSDTGARPGSVPVELWSMNADNETAVAIALADAYGVSDQLPLPDQLTIIVAGMIRDYWMEHREHLIGNIDGSKLMGYDEGAIGSAFRRAAAASTIYTILNRCGYEPDKLLSPDDFKDVQLFSTADTIAGVGSAVSISSGLVLRQIERTVREYERSHEHDRTDLHPEGRLLLSESDGGRTEDTAAGQVRTDAPDIPEGTFPGAAEPARPERDAVSAPDGDRQDRPGEDRPDDAHLDGAERRDGGTEAPGSDEVGGADEQLSPADRGDDPERTGVQLSEEPAEDLPESSPETEEPEAPPAPAAPTMEEALQAVVRIQPDSEQLNLFDFPMLTEAEQIASINQAESAPAPFAFPVAQSDIDHILRTGDNTRHHRQLIVSEFSKGKPPEQLVPLLKEVYHGGNGIVTEHGRISAWYGEDGIHLSKGSAARYVNTAHIVPWKDVASRIYELLAEGNFATNLEIAEAPSFERHNIADYLCYVARDLSDTGKEAGYLPTLRAVRGNGFPDEVARIEELLADPDQYAVIADEVSTFYAAYEADRKLMRFRLPYITECAVAVEEYAMPRRDYDSQMIEVPAVGRFITDDEVDSVIEGGQGSYSGAALRIYQFFQEKRTDAERADFLKHIYGIGGRMPGVSGAFHSSEDHDTKGIKLKKADCEPVMLKWNKVAKRVEHMIQHSRYLTPEQQAEMEAIRDAHDEPEEVAEAPTLEEAPVPAEEAIAVPAEIEVDNLVPAESADRSADYRLLDRLRTDCEYFLGAGQRHERDLWAGNVYAHIEKMREIYASLPDKPEWLTETQIDSYADRMAPPYLVVAYHHFENGFDAKMDYQTIDAAEKAAQGYIEGTMEIDGFHYDGAAVYDQSEKRYLRVYGDFPDEKAIAQATAAGQPVQESMSPAADILTPVTETPYRVGDILYLDDLPFEVESIGKFDVHLRDPNAAYPIMRAESRERLAHLLMLDKRNASFIPADKGEPDVGVIDGESSLTEADAVLTADDHELPDDESIQQIRSDEPEPTITVDTVPEIEIIPENYRINDEHLGEGGPKAKFRVNVEAIRVLKGLEASGRPASTAEQEILARYVGWGGLADAFDESKPAWASECAELKNLLTRSEYEAARASTLNAHYTSPTIIRAIYETIDRMGFTTGNILEPAMGVGNFFGMLPESMSASRLYGVELDSITGRIAQKLYPQADITVAGFETTDRRDFFDLAIGNVPFGNYQVHDPAYNKLGFSIHDYFFAKTLDQVRPGGVIAFVTSRYTLDKQSPEVRRYIAQRAEFLGAVRLPNNAFKANAGTDVVSDIIFLQKRDRAIEIDPDWVHLGSNPDGFAINSYFVDHPEMIIGRQSSTTTQYGKQDFTVEPIEGANLAVQLASAMQNITGRYEAAELPDLEDGETISDAIPADPNVRNYSYTVVDDKVYYRENSLMVRPELNVTAQERVKGMVALRDCVRELIDLQMGDATDEMIYAQQAELNRLYDIFTEKYGLINSRGNSLAFSADSSYYLLCSLEELNEQGELDHKADMFYKRTIRQHKVVDHVDTVEEALAVSIAERARVDIPYMLQLTGMPEDQLLTDLGRSCYRLPGTAMEYVTADEYLSGNVREKLREARAAAENDPAFEHNVRALEAAQPVDLEASEISVRLGATWIDKEYIQQFMHETFSTPPYLRRQIKVEYSPHTAEWRVSGKTGISSTNIAANVTYGTSRANAYKILEDSLNLRDVRIFDIVEDPDGTERRVLNQKETTLAQQKQQSIKDAFSEWIWRDPDRRHYLVTLYNERFNAVRPREYDGRHIAFGGISPEITLREHQRNAIAHILYGGNTLLAHQVGAGKTFEMVAAAMEAKRLGLCTKSMIVVPNHLTEQWASEFLRLYPSANILVTTKRDFEKSRRKKFCARIATGDYDAVIIGHSQFERIPISQERQERLLQEQIDEITAGIEEIKRESGERYTVKQMEKSRRQLEARLQKLQANGKKDDVITFEELGVDRLFVDEAHLFKNLFLLTKMRNVAGLSTSEAQKSSDMFAKCRYMDEITGGRGVIFATGTPVSNSMTEMYTMQRYLQYETLQRNNMTHFDCWASTFGESVTAIELAPEGTGYRARTRFAKFYNLPELMTMFKEVADIKTADQLHLPTPTAHYETIAVKPSELQQEMVQSLSERAAKIHSGSVDPSIDNMLKITSDGRKLGLDQRLINPMLPDDPGSKVNACVANVFRIWENGHDERLTQLIFCDISTPKSTAGTESREFSVYDDIRAKLIGMGVPAEQIAFIHEAESEAKKKELFAKVRAGDVRVLLGSTAKMGAGTNCQDRLIATHDLDCPWRPGDLEQRAGRIVRQGNRNQDVYVYRYVTEGTFDAYLWQTIENKQKFISQIMSSKSPVRSCEDLDETALSYAEIKALCAGDPRIKEKMDLDVDVARLRLMKADHQSKQYQLEDRLLRYFPAEIALAEQRLYGFQTDLDTLAAHPVPEKDFVGIEVLGHHYTDRLEAGNAMIAACKEAGRSGKLMAGHYRGLEMMLMYDPFDQKFKLTLQGGMHHAVELGNDPRGNLQRMENALAMIPLRMATQRDQLNNIHAQIKAAEEEKGRPFPQEEELRTKSERLAQLDAELNIDKPRTAPEEERIAKVARPSLREQLKAPRFRSASKKPPETEAR